MERYRSRPTEVEAIQWTGENLPEMYAAFGRVKRDLEFDAIGLFTRAGPYIRFSKGDWAVRQADGDVRRLDAEEFERAYEPAPPRPQEG